MSSQDDLLHDFEIGMAQVLVNMNVYIEPEGLLNISLGETQSPENYGDTKILSPSKDTNCKAEIDIEVIQELENQSGDMLLVENSHEGLDLERICQEKEVEIEIIRELDNQLGDIVLLEQSQGEQSSSLEIEAINETISRPVTPSKRYGAKKKLGKLRKEHQKLRKTVKRL